MCPVFSRWPAMFLWLPAPNCSGVDKVDCARNELIIQSGLVSKIGLLFGTILAVALCGMIRDLSMSGTLFAANLLVAASDHGHLAGGAFPPSSQPASTP